MRYIPIVIVATVNSMYSLSGLTFNIRIHFFSLLFVIVNSFLFLYYKWTLNYCSVGQHTKLITIMDTDTNKQPNFSISITCNYTSLVIRVCHIHNSLTPVTILHPNGSQWHQLKWAVVLLLLALMLTINAGFTRMNDDFCRIRVQRIVSYETIHCICALHPCDIDSYSLNPNVVACVDLYHRELL